MSPRRLPRPERIAERGSAVVSVLVLLATALLVVVGARVFGGAAVEQLRCQGDAVRAIGSGPLPGCGDGKQRAWLASSPAPAGSGSPGTSRPEPRPIGRAGLVARGSATTLAPLFQIVESSAERAAQNQVTEEEFDAIVDLYDAVREERTRLQHTDRAAPFLGKIMADMALILQTEGGRALIDMLAHHSQWTFLSVGFIRNADGEEDPALGLDASNALAEYDGEIGYVTYAPGEWVELPGIDLELNPWARWRSDVALYHELVHVLDYLMGTADPRIAEEGGVTFSAMEYQAIGLGPWQNGQISENAYRAARREIAKLGTGAAIGDADMPHRPRYIPTLPPADPPGPRPRPAAGDSFQHLDDR